MEVTGKKIKRLSKEMFLSEGDLRKFVHKWNNLLEEIEKIPEEFIRENNHISNPHEVKAFDSNRYFDVFDKTRIKDGYVLDYVYDEVVVKSSIENCY